MIALLLAALFQGAPASTVAASTAAPPAKSVQADKRVCRKETVVGSTIKKRISSRPVEERAEADTGEKAQVLQTARE